MRVLLDTHVLLWAGIEPRRLSPRVRDLLVDPGSELVVSPVSAVEIAIKAAGGKLVFDDSVAAFWRSQKHALRWVELPFREIHALEMELLTKHHQDPFDWMLVAQARVEGLPLVTRDGNLPRYDVPIIW